jgi:hypothetical protein
MSNEINTSKSVDKLRIYFKKHKSDSYPITEHPLERADEYTKGIYITMLCTIMCNNSEPREEQRLFIERLMKGIGISTIINDYIKKALEIDDKFAEEFVRQLKDNELKYNFVVDSLVLASSVGSPKKKDVEFISEICEMLAISKEDVEFYSNMALGIVEQDSKNFKNSSEESLNLEKINKFRYYYKDFFDGALVNDKRLLYYHGNKNKTLNIEELISHIEGTRYEETTYLNITRNVIFEDCNINFQELQISFECQQVELINCNITGVNQIQFVDCNTIKIINCKFNNFGKRAILISSSSNLELNKCQFNDCGYINTNSYVAGGVIHVNKLNCINIKDCEFNRCFVKSREGFEAKGIILHTEASIYECYINNNLFNDCTSSSNRTCLFSSRLRLENFNYDNNRIIGTTQYDVIW